MVPFLGLPIKIIPIFRTRAPFKNLPKNVNFFSKLICRFGDIKGSNETGAVRIFLILNCSSD